MEFIKKDINLLGKINDKLEEIIELLLEQRKFRVGDTVEAKTDIPHLGIKKGTVGDIVKYYGWDSYINDYIYLVFFEKIGTVEVQEKDLRFLYREKKPKKVRKHKFLDIDIEY